MKTNFEIEEAYAVRHRGLHIDLHNNFDFVGLVDDTDRNEVTLRFEKSKGDWVWEDEFSRLTFLLKNVTYRYFEDGDNTGFPDDAKCVSEITFFPSSLRDVNHSFTHQSTPDETDDLLFHFQDGRIVRVGCDEAALIVEE